MIFNLMNKIALFAFAGLLVFSSCKKDISAPINPTTSDVGFNMIVNAKVVQNDAFAAYCENDGVEFIMIANKVENLNLPLQTENFEADDYVYFTSISDESTWAYGGQALGEEVTGFAGLSILFSDTELRLTSNDGNLITGAANGTLLGMDGQGDFSEYPYAMNFVAEIVQESDFCTQAN